MGWQRARGCTFVKETGITTAPVEFQGLSERQEIKKQSIHICRYTAARMGRQTWREWAEGWDLVCCC